MTGNAKGRLAVHAPTLALALLLSACGCRGEKRDTVNVIGSTSVQPFAEMLAQEFNARQQQYYVEVQGGGSMFGIQAVANGIADIGTCSRSLQPGENYTGIAIARDGVAVVVNNSNPVPNLTRAQIRALFAGQVDNWRQVGGPDRPVRLVTREEGSGTREAFFKLVMHNQRMSRRALTQPSNGAVKTLVAGDPAAIGYMSLGQVGTEVRAVNVDGVEPTVPEVVEGRYPLVRPFLFVVAGQPGAKARAFIDFVLSPQGQQMLETEGLVRVQ